jgi:hypothetical protein
MGGKNAWSLYLGALKLIALFNCSCHTSRILCWQAFKSVFVKQCREQHTNKHFPSFVLLHSFFYNCETFFIQGPTQNIQIPMWNKCPFCLLILPVFIQTVEHRICQIVLRCHAVEMTDRAVTRATRTGAPNAGS